MTRFTCLVLGAVLLQVPFARAAEPEKLIPAEADTVAVVNVKEILASDVVKKYALEQLKQVLDGQDVKQFLTDLGMDPFKDVDKLVVATTDTGLDVTQGLMVLYGKFDPKNVFKAAEALAKKNPEQFSIIKDGDTVMFKYQPEEIPQAIYATVLDEKRVIAANDKKLIINALKVSDSQKEPAIKKELAELIKKADDKASVFVVTVLKGKLDNVMLPAAGNLPVQFDGVEKLMPKMESATMTMKIGTDILVDVSIGMSDEDSARAMHTAVRDLMRQVQPIVQLAGAADPRGKPLLDVFGSIKTDTDKKNVTMSGKVTGANINAMLNPVDN